MPFQVGDTVQERGGRKWGKVIKIGKGGGYIHKVKLARWGQERNVFREELLAPVDDPVENNHPVAQTSASSLPPSFCSGPE